LPLAFLVLCAASRARAQPAAAQGKGISGPRAADGAAGGPKFPLLPIYKDGFRLQTADARSELQLAASTQLDGRFYEGASVAPHSFDIRRARIDINAKLFKLLSIRIQAAMEDSPYIRNAMVDIHIWKEYVNLRVGQMKVPFSSTWLAFDNQVDFLERPVDVPLYPFFDRGGMVWGHLLGGRLSYNLGVFNGSGVDLDLTKGDLDDTKDLAWRVMVQPFRATPVRLLEGLFLVGNGTWGFGSVTTRRYEGRGLTAANFESQVFRFRSDQTIGTNGRQSDVVAGGYDSRTRWGAELHYLKGPFTLSAEWTRVDYKGFRIYHEFYQGSKRLKRDLVLERDGKIQNLSAFVSVFLTGEQKHLDIFGWKQPVPRRPLGLSERGIGAWELLARFSATLSDRALFDQQKVSGFAAKDFADPDAKLAGPAPAEGGSVTAAILEGAPKLYEITGALNWTMNYHLRVQLDYVYLWAPDYELGGKHGIVSAGNSDLADVTLKNKLVKAEHMLGFRIIMRI
jgi:phosphate-selective porin